MPERKGPSYARLDQTAIKAALASLDGWTVIDDGRVLSRSFRFKTFAQAFSFMAEMALLAEKMNHHPEWFNSYGRVDVRLVNHAAGGITDLDVDMAAMMNRAAARRDLKPV